MEKFKMYDRVKDNDWDIGIFVAYYKDSLWLVERESYDEGLDTGSIKEDVPPEYVNTWNRTYNRVPLSDLTKIWEVKLNETTCPSNWCWKSLWDILKEVRNMSEEPYWTFTYCSPVQDNPFLLEWLRSAIEQYRPEKTALFNQSLTTNNKPKMSKLQEIKAKNYFTDEKLEELSSLSELAKDRENNLDSVIEKLECLSNRLSHHNSRLNYFVDTDCINASKEVEKELKELIEEYNSLGLDKLKIPEEE